MTMPQHECEHAGCRTLIPFNERFCDRHKQEQPKPYWPSRDYKARLHAGGRYYAFYKSKQWRKLSYSWRLGHPLCAKCEARGLYVPVDVVDHIIPIRVDWSRRYDETNLQSLCNTCHNAKSREDIERYHLTPLKEDQSK